MNRRHFFASASAIAILPNISLAEGNVTHLRAETITQQILPAGENPTEMLGFNGSTPGPELRVRRGDRVVIDVENGLNVDTAVHWHGIRLENQMDGVPSLTQEPIKPGDIKTYNFIPPDAGTYWYHPHHMSQEQVARGMIGPLIVEEATPPDVDHDITVVMSDWRVNEDGSLVEQYDDMHSVAHGGYMGNFARAFLSKSQVQIGDRVRLRIINAATNRIFRLAINGVSGNIVALDGMPLAEPRPLSELEIAPAQRVDLIVDVASTVSFDMITRQGSYRLADLKTDGSNTRRKAGPIPVLPSNNLSEPGDPTQHLTLTMMGGAMGGRHGGDNIWSFNNISDLTENPFGDFRRGETARITLVNDTAFPHGMPSAWSPLLRNR